MKSQDIEMKEFLFELLSIQTTDDKPDELAKAVELVAARFLKTRFHVKKYIKNGYSSVVISTHDQLHSDVILSGHLDVVHADSQQLFTPKEIEGKVYARGAIDMKGPVVALIYALLELETNTNLFAKNISLILTSDEEIGGYFGVDYLLGGVGYRADIAFLPDGGDNWHLCTDEKGVLQLQVTVNGKAAHGSRPWKGENSILKHMKMFDEMKDLVAKRWGVTEDGEIWKTSINLGKLSGGENANSVPAASISLIDIRYPAEVDGEELLSHLRAVADRYEAEVLVKIIGCATHIDDDNVYLKSWKASVLRTKDQSLTPIKSEGASDARHYAKYNIPSIISLPNCSAGHIDNEWIDYQDLLLFKDTLKDWLVGL